MSTTSRVPTSTKPLVRLRRGPRRRRDTEPPFRAIAKGLAASAVVGAIIWLGISAYNGVPFTNYSTVYVSIPAVGNLLEHDPVRIGGVRVGQVLSKGLGSDGRVHLKLQLDPGVRLPATTTAAIRAQGLLGARYVELVPGGGRRMLASGTTIQAPASALSYGVTDALDTFDAQTRGALGTMVRELGAGVLGRGAALNDAIRLSAGDIVPFQKLAETILSHPGAAQRLLPALNEMTTALSRSRVEMSQMFAPAATAMAPFADQRTAVRAALDEAPGALSAATAGLAEGNRLLDATTALAHASNTTLPDAPAGLRAATALLADTHVDLQRAAALLDAARPAIPAALAVTGGLRPLLAPLMQGLDNLITVARQVTPYGCNIINLGAVFRSMTGSGGYGTGPNGPAMEFRLTVVPGGGVSNVGGADSSGLTPRDGYPPPCKYVATTYPQTTSPTAGSGLP
jgi:phospholipid/cholesterol/gamma-HCH transport system substrate-binding protein